MTKIYIVRAEEAGRLDRNCIIGVYPTEELAQARIDDVESQYGKYWFDYVWFDIVEVGANGADCMLKDY